MPHPLLKFVSSSRLLYVSFLFSHRFRLMFELRFRLVFPSPVRPPVSLIHAAMAGGSGAGILVSTFLIQPV